MKCVNKPLYREIYESILNKINEGEWKYGDKIPSEKELADQFNVSRITSKKALDLLSQEKRIKRIQGKGSFVTKGAASNSSVTLEANSQLRKDIFTVGLIISDFSESFGVTLVKQIEKEITKLGGLLYLKLSLENVVEEEKAIEELLDIGVDGLIILPVHGEHYNMKILELVLRKFPLVLIDRYLRGIQASAVLTDNIRASTVATNYLFSLGHREVAYITPPDDGTTVLADRLTGYQQAFHQQQYPYNPEIILTSSVTDYLVFKEQGAAFEEELKKIQQFLLENPTITGFVSCRYSLAIVLQHVIHTIGKEVPKDYSVVCFDSPKMNIGPFPFTHILQDEVGIAKKTVLLLHEKMKGKNHTEKELVQFELIEGLSTREV